MEGELAARAAADLKVAEELKRTEKYKGKFVWDDALGAYVPESSVVKPKIDAAEVAPVVAAIEDAVPNNNPAVANVAGDTDATAAARLDRTEEAAVGLDADGMMAATRTQEVAPALADDAARISDEAFAEDYRKYIEERANQPLDDFEGVGAYITEDFPSKTGGVEFGASLAKQRADNLRKADDAAMAAAIQDDLFTNASPAAYENYQASRLAALADDTALATAAPKGMITSRAAGPISRTKDIDIPPPPSVPKLTAKPESASRGFKDLEINPSRVLPAAQRVAAAASQTGLQGERGTDGSFLPELPDRGIDIDQSIGASIPKPAPVEIIKSSEKPGWYQGVTKEDDDDGNYWSADFEDEHWNTPAGVQEAIGIWGRPVGNRIGQRFN